LERKECAGVRKARIYELLEGPSEERGEVKSFDGTVEVVSVSTRGRGKGEGGTELVATERRERRS